MKTRVLDAFVLLAYLREPRTSEAVWQEITGARLVVPFFAVIEAERLIERARLHHFEKEEMREDLHSGQDGVIPPHILLPDQSISRRYLSLRTEAVRRSGGRPIVSGDEIVAWVEAFHESLVSDSEFGHDIAFLTSSPELAKRLGTMAILVPLPPED